MAKRRHGRRGMMPKTLGGWFGMAFKILGGVTMLAPAIDVVIRDVPGNVESIPTDVLYAYTGYSVKGQNINFAQTGVGAASLAGGFVIAKIGTLASRLLR